MYLTVLIQTFATLKNIHTYIYNNLNINNLPIVFLTDGNCDAALFLLNHGADVNARTKQDETCLELAIKKNLIGALEALCRLGADMSKSVRQDYLFIISNLAPKYFMSLFDEFCSKLR